MFLFYLPFETLRVLLHAWRQNAELLYGVNCQGALVASLVGRVLRKPVVTRFHGVSISEADLRSWVTKLLVLDEIVGLKAPANAVIITNDGTRGDRIAELLGVDAKRVYFWRNGWDKADLEYDDPAWSAEAFKGELGIQGRRVLLMVSRLASWKRVDRGIRCLASLVKHYGRRDTILLVVGDGPLKNTLEDLAQKLDVREYVVFAGRVPHRSIWRYYRISDVFLSLYDVSNLGNPLFEAMYFGLPIVTLKGPGVADLLKDGYNAILVGEEELDEELPRKVNWLLQEGRMAAELGENAKQTLASNVLSWEERMRLETELIGKILIA
jgi:glycosyltransferase involved in cell wall biosynthesis